MSSGLAILLSYKHCRESLSYMAVEKPEGTIVLTSFIGGSSYFQVIEQGPSFWGEMLSENYNALRKEPVQGLEEEVSLESFCYGEESMNKLRSFMEMESPVADQFKQCYCIELGL